MDKNMLINKLNQKYNNKENHVAADDYMDMLHNASKQLKANHKDVAIAIEEISELNKVLIKLLRGRMSIADAEVDLMEEIADVKIAFQIFSMRFTDASAGKIYNDSMMVYTSDCNKFNDLSLNEAIKHMVRELSKLGNYISLYFDRFTSDWIYKDILATYVSLNGLIYKFCLNDDKLRYTEDIKVERIMARIRNGEKL